MGGSRTEQPAPRCRRGKQGAFRATMGRTMLSVALSSVLTLESCATASRPTWQPLDISPDPDVIRIVMQHAPGAIIEASFVKPDALKPAPQGAVSVQITVRNVGKQSLRIRSGQSELYLADGSRLVIHRTPPPPEETKTSAEPSTEESSLPTRIDAPASATEEPKTPAKTNAESPPVESNAPTQVDTPASAEEPKTPATKETAKQVALGAGIVVGTIVEAAVIVAVHVYAPVLVAAAVVTSPIWGPFVIVARYRQRAQLRSVLDATLQEGDVVLAHGELASAVLQFDGDAAGLGTAFFVVRVTDEVERDWTAKVPLAIPK